MDVTVTGFDADVTDAPINDATPQNLASLDNFLLFTNRIYILVGCGVVLDWWPDICCWGCYSGSVVLVELIIIVNSVLILQ